MKERLRNPKPVRVTWMNSDGVFSGFWRAGTKGMGKLGSTVREQLKKKLVEVLEHPGLKQTSSVVCLIVTRLSSVFRLSPCIPGYRRESCRFRVSVGKRERSEVYSEAVKRILEPKHDISVSHRRWHFCFALTEKQAMKQQKAMLIALIVIC